MIRISGSESKLVQDLERRVGIDRKPGAYRGARRIVDFVDQPGGQFDELALFVGRMFAGLHVKVGQHAQQSRPDIDALAAGERHQAIETRK